MRKYSSVPISTMFAIFLLASSLFFVAKPASAQTSETALSMSDLKTIFVDGQQYFGLDNEQTVSASINHLHITQLDTTTGAFQGAINAPVVPSIGAIQQVLPVAGKITIVAVGPSTVYPFGNYYEITFSWQYSPDQCDYQTATYTGSILFLGYDGSGKMHGTIGGSVSNNIGVCTLGAYTLGPVPFSGQMLK